MKLFTLFRKALFRAFRLLMYRRRVFGEIGKGNRFLYDVFISEDAKVGKNNYFGPRTMVNNAVIGNYCSFAPDVKIGQGEHSMDFYTTYQKISHQVIGHSLNKEPTIIMHDVWCGANVVIKQGVRIGTGAVIGANSVVTKSIPDYAIAVGSPAKVIKYRFDEKEIQLVKSSNWYDHDYKSAVKKLQLLQQKKEKVKM